jgi:hypothetical protein
MRTTLIFIAVLLGFWCSGQTIRNLNDSSTETIYRGFENTIVISKGVPLTENDYILACSECSVSKINHKGDSLPPNTFILTPNKTRYTDLLIVGKNGDTTIHQFKISNLPDPELYLDEIKSGETLLPILNESKWILSAKYPPGISLVSIYEIISWECAVDGVLLSAALSNDIPEELINKINSLSSGSEVTFKSVVLSEQDGIRRLKTGIFPVN